MSIDTDVSQNTNFMEFYRIKKEELPGMRLVNKKPEENMAIYRPGKINIHLLGLDFLRDTIKFFTSAVGGHDIFSNLGLMKRAVKWMSTDDGLEKCSLVDQEKCSDVDIDHRWSTSTK